MNIYIPYAILSLRRKSYYNDNDNKNQDNTVIKMLGVKDCMIIRIKLTAMKVQTHFFLPHL